MADTGLVNGRAKVKHQRRDDPGTESAEGVVRATGGGVWEGGRAPSRKKIEFRSQIYNLWCIQGVFFRLSLAGFNASNVLDDLDHWFASAQL